MMKWIYHNYREPPSKKTPRKSGAVINDYLDLAPLSKSQSGKPVVAETSSKAKGSIVFSIDIIIYICTC